ncbi:glycoside hydrolase superfamily [Fennellomyces sp. T-0311]|nr:glycoside hydrolase superfamily [Fennellomyces sp. T-0311]
MHCFFSILVLSIAVITTALGDLLVTSHGNISACTLPHKLTAYVVDWDLPKSIPWDKLDYINYAFGVPNQHGQLTLFDPDQLRSLVNDAHSHSKGVSLSVGGWTGSVYFSLLVRTQESRESFANILVNACEEYNLDGIDIDWEYPNSPDGVSCNKNHPEDTSNFLKFIQLLRSKLDTKFTTRKWLTGAVAPLVFNDAKQQPTMILDPAWSSAFDAYLVMGYDMNGYWNEYTGPNAPLFYGGVNHGPSVDRAIRAWAKAGVPRERLVMGVPFFGYRTRVTQPDGQYTTIDHSHPQIQGDRYDSKEGEPCPSTNYSFSGEMQWRSIRAEVLRNSSWNITWDEITKTSYAYNGNQYLSFDDPKSFQAKIDYVKRYKLGGMMLWSLEMDDSQHTLLDALQTIYVNSTTTS